MAVRNNFFLAVFCLLAVPLLRGTANLDRIRSAECLEQSAALIGVCLIVPLGAPEQPKTIRELVSVRKIPYRKILLLRFGMSLSALVLLTGLFAGVMRWNHCTFPFVLYVAEAAVKAAALGSMGFLAAVWSRSVTVGYLAAAGYFLFLLV